MQEEKKKDNFILYNNMFEMLEELTDSEAGEVIKDVFRYSIDGSIPEYEKGSGKSIVFKSIKNTIDINNKKYIEKCKQNSDNANARWHPEKVIFKNREFTEKQYEEYSKNNRTDYTFKELLDKEMKLFRNGKIEEIKNGFCNNLITNETINSIFKQ